MREIEKSAASVEDAIDVALAELGVSEQEADIEIVQEPRTGFLGRNAQPAVVRVRTRDPDEAAAPAENDEIDAGDRASLDSSEAVSDDREHGFNDTEEADVAADFVAGLLDAMGLDADVDIVDDEGSTYIDVIAGEHAEDMGLLIGKHGATLDALQELTRTAVQQAVGMRSNLLVDVEDYRKRRRAQLSRRARDAAQRVAKTGRPVTLEAMNAFERKIVHDAASAVHGVATASEGEEPNRRVIIRKA